MAGTAAHTYLKRKLKKMLAAQGAYVLPSPAGATSGKGRTDLTACLRGQFIGLEVKTGAAKAYPLQHDHMQSIRIAGGLAFIARDVNTAQRAIRVYLERKSWEGIVATKTDELEDEFDDMFEDDEEEAPPPRRTRAATPPPAPAKRGRPAGSTNRPKPEPEDDEDDEEEERPQRRPAPAGKQFKLATAKDNPALTKPETAVEKLNRLENDLAIHGSTLTEILEISREIRDELRELRERASDEQEPEAPPPVPIRGGLARRAAPVVNAKTRHDEDFEDDDEAGDGDDDLIDDLFEDEPPPTRKAAPSPRGRRPR